MLDYEHGGEGPPVGKHEEVKEEEELVGHKRAHKDLHAGGEIS